MDSRDANNGKRQASIETEDWWPFDDDDGVEDAAEREMLEEAERGEWRSVPNLGEEMKRAREMARATMATWDQERLAAVARRWAGQRVKEDGAAKSPPPLAGDGVSGDNPAQG